MSEVACVVLHPQTLVMDKLGVDNQKSRSRRWRYLLLSGLLAVPDAFFRGVKSRGNGGWVGEMLWKPGWHRLYCNTIDGRNNQGSISVVFFFSFLFGCNTVYILEYSQCTVPLMGFG